MLDQSNQYVDDKYSFRHIIYPNEVVMNPTYIIRIKSKTDSKVVYSYGCWILPDYDDLKKNIVPLRVFEHEEYAPFDYDENNYELTIEKTK